MPATILKPESTRARSNPVVRTVPESEPAAAGRAEENEWIERARAGDTAAYRRLVERYSEVAYGLALRMLGSPSDAEEVAQDGFVRAWLALPRFRGDSSFSTWLHRIVARRALDRAATLRRRRVQETDLARADAIPAAGPVDDRVPALRLERILAELSEPQRAMIAL